MGLIGGLMCWGLEVAAFPLDVVKFINDDLDIPVVNDILSLSIDVAVATRDTIIETVDMLTDADYVWLGHSSVNTTRHYDRRTNTICISEQTIQEVFGSGQAG